MERINEVNTENGKNVIPEITLAMKSNADAPGRDSSSFCYSGWRHSQFLQVLLQVTLWLWEHVVPLS